MSLVSQDRVIAAPAALFKTIVLSAAVVTTVVMTGCASKPQINNATRYATAPDYYTVRSGDTLSGIAARYGLSYVSIAEMNDIAQPYRIYVGQSIRLKNGGARRTTSTQSDDTSCTNSATNDCFTNTKCTCCSCTNDTTNCDTYTSTNACWLLSSSLRWVSPVCTTYGAPRL